jgi:predicted transcriptional regulator
MTQDKAVARQRATLLKRLREEHQETVERTRTLLKAQQEARRAICQAMRNGAETVPDIAAASGQASDQVLWHITAMKKYDLVTETGKDGDYYRYALVQEAGE